MSSILDWDKFDANKRVNAGMAAALEKFGTGRVRTVEARTLLSITLRPKKHPLALISGMPYTEAITALEIKPGDGKEEALGFRPKTKNHPWPFNMIHFFSWGKRREEIRLLNNVWADRLLAQRL